uniref:Nucleolar 27S pre-rRNA processing Urb2/Npa2 C-terminal domain-containing protein n=1 Tax=Eutreptiella gymnastica TaxID=73025 RepID=A0A7S1NEL0_9EUGL
MTVIDKALDDAGIVVGTSGTLQGGAFNAASSRVALHTACSALVKSLATCFDPIFVKLCHLLTACTENYQEALVYHYHFLTVALSLLMTGLLHRLTLMTNLHLVMKGLELELHHKEVESQDRQEQQTEQAGQLVDTLTRLYSLVPRLEFKKYAHLLVINYLNCGKHYSEVMQQHKRSLERGVREVMTCLEEKQAFPSIYATVDDGGKTLFRRLQESYHESVYRGNSAE